MIDMGCLLGLLCRSSLRCSFALGILGRRVCRSLLVVRCLGRLHRLRGFRGLRSFRGFGRLFLLLGLHRLLLLILFGFICLGLLGLHVFLRRGFLIRFRLGRLEHFFGRLCLLARVFLSHGLFLLRWVNDEFIVGIAQGLTRLLRADADDVGLLLRIEHLRDAHKVRVRRDDEVAAHALLIEQFRRIVEGRVQGVLAEEGPADLAECEPRAAQELLPALLLRALLPVRDHDRAARLEASRLAERVVEHLKRRILDVVEDADCRVAGFECHSAASFRRAFSMMPPPTTVSPA